jgi:RimJ/RimL family protein N-acetyltransferase
VDALFELLTDPQVSQYISQPPSSAAGFEGFIEWAHRQREAGTCVCFGVVPHGLEHAIGLFQVRALDSTFQTPVSVLSHRPVRRRSPGRKLMRRARQG